MPIPSGLTETVTSVFVPPYDVAAWGSFLTTTATAAGVLLGLALVAASARREDIRKDDELNGHSFELLLLLIVVLLFGLLALAPIPSHALLGGLLTSVAVVGLGAMLSQQSWPSGKWSACRILLALLEVGPSAVAGLSLAFRRGGGPAWSAGVVVGVSLSLFLGMANVWLLLVADPVGALGRRMRPDRGQRG
jgi:hypothetical protein